MFLDLSATAFRIRSFDEDSEFIYFNLFQFIPWAFFGGRFLILHSGSLQFVASDQILPRRNFIGYFISLRDTLTMCQDEERSRNFSFLY